MAALSTIRERAGRVNGWLLLLLAFCLPLSTTAVTVLGSLLLVGWLILGVAASSVAIARRRTTSLAAVIAAG